MLKFWKDKNDDLPLTEVTIYRKFYFHKTKRYALHFISFHFDISGLPFTSRNCETGGDLVCDTPPDCRINNENQYPGCAINYNLCEHSGSYIDYNGQSINNPSEGNVVLNHMSYHSSCKNEFTPEQIARMDFYYTTFLTPYQISGYFLE